MAKAKTSLTKGDKIEALVSTVNKALGESGRVFVGKDLTPLRRIETGLLSLDSIMGGGLPRRKYTELYGHESSGKTTLALLIVAAVQRAGGTCAWVVGEEFDAVEDAWAERLGVDVSKLIKIEAYSGDLMLETAASLIESGLLDLLVIDSVQAVGTKREIDAGVDSEAFASAGVGPMWARFYRRCRSAFNSRVSDTAILSISQVREKIGGFSPNGKPEPVPTQIRILLHWKSISIQCKRGEPVYVDKDTQKKKIASREFNLKCVKNKTAPPERVSSYRMNFLKQNFGYDYIEELVRLGKVYGVISGGGKVLKCGGIKVTGDSDMPAIDKFKAALAKKPVAMQGIRTDILEAILEGG